MESTSVDEMNHKRESYHSVNGIPESALCMICFKPFCDIRCKGPCMRFFHTSCIKHTGTISRHWKCQICANKETDKFTKMFRFVREDSEDRREVVGSGFSEVSLLDTNISHKKRDAFALKTVKCSECNERYRSQLLRCINCGTMYHRGCLPINSIQLSSRFIICPAHYQSTEMAKESYLDSGSDYLHQSLQDQFDKLKGTGIASGRGGHALRGRGRGRGRGGIGARGGRVNKRLNQIVTSDPVLYSTKCESVKCERCGRVHKFPEYVDRRYLPRHWFCEYDVWNKGQASCDIDDSARKEAAENEITQKESGTPAIWGGETMKTGNKFVPINLNSVALLNYLYFSKIASKATDRVNYLGFISSSYAFHPKMGNGNESTQSLAENKPICKKAQSLLAYFRDATTLSIREIMQNKFFFSCVFDNQRPMLVQCVRFLLEQNLVVLASEGALTDDTIFVINDKPGTKGESVKDLRLRHEFQSS